MATNGPFVPSESVSNVTNNGIATTLFSPSEGIQHSNDKVCSTNDDEQ